jgi:outer membrane lipoprotein-sorting protein
MLLRRAIISVLMAWIACNGYCASLMDLSKARDARTRAALQEIVNKQAAIKEVVIEDHSSTFTQKGKLIQAASSKIMHRLPGLIYLQTKNTAHPGDLDGTVVDGTTLWKIHILGSVSIHQQTERMKKASVAQDEINRRIRQGRVTRSRIDLQKMRDAGFYDKMIGVSTWYLNPMSVFPVQEWKLVGETPRTWLFTAKFTPVLDKNEPALTARLTFSKQTGLCVLREMVNGDIASTDALAGVTVNPAPPIESRMFRYEPPAGADVKDETATFIKIYQQTFKKQTP